MKYLRLLILQVRKQKEPVSPPAGKGFSPGRLPQLRLQVLHTPLPMQVRHRLIRQYLPRFLLWTWGLTRLSVVNISTGVR